MITRFSVVTLVFFILSITFVIHPISFPIRLPYVGKRRVPINLTTAPILIIAILWAAQCLGATQIRNGIVGTDDVKPYNILILFSSLAYMAITLDVTGVLQAAAFWVSNKGGTSGRKLYFYFYVMLTLLSILLGNDPVILSGTVFLVYYTTATELEPLPWLISEFSAANTASMVLFLGNPTNVVICEGFSINNVAFTAYTILPFLVCNVFCYFALIFQFRGNHIPRKRKTTGHLDPRSVLRDRFGAWYGSILLGSCLAVIIVVSFFHVDVWMITLPFAVVKFIFDLCWDHYRFTRGLLPRHEHITEDGKTVEDTVIDDDPMLKAIRRATTSPNIIDSPAQTLHGSTELRSKVEEKLRRVEENPSPAHPLPTEEKPPLLEEKPPLAGEKPPSAMEKPPSAEEKPSTAAFADSTEDRNLKLFHNQRAYLQNMHTTLARHFPTFFTALPRLPFALVPFAFSQFILIEALEHQGWIDVFGHWLARASRGHIYPTVWLIGVLGVVLCNLAGTNIGATILLTKVVRAAPDFPSSSTRAAGIALAVASNIGAVSFTFSASLAGLLWKSILEQKGIEVKQKTFAFWNMIPMIVMTTVGLAVVSAEMAVLY